MVLLCVLNRQLHRGLPDRASDEFCRCVLHTV